MQILIGGKTPLTSNTPVATQPMAGGKSQPSFIGNTPQSWVPPQGGQFHQPRQGGPSNPNPQGGVPNPSPSGLHSGKPFPGVPNPTWESRIPLGSPESHLVKTLITML
jgi:hypothetical protein